MVDGTVVLVVKVEAKRVLVGVDEGATGSCGSYCAGGLPKETLSVKESSNKSLVSEEGRGRLRRLEKLQCKQSWAGE